MLLTKLNIPSTGRNLVQRSDLFDQLNEGLKRKLILISAPAGFGKTSLISNWISHCQVNAVWISLDKRDNDPTEFLSYVIAGIQGIQAGYGQAALTLLKSPNLANPESIASLMINDLTEIEQEFLVVLDDFHLISSTWIVQFLSYFLEHVPEKVHVAISTRSDPLLPLARLRSQQQLLELRSPELSFSANEISVLFTKKMKIKLSEEDIYSLESKTEGWIAGLQLAALSMQGNENVADFIRAFAGNNRYIMDYLIEEVLNTLPGDIKDFLLKTSVMEQISGPLCNWVLDRDDSQSVIEQLEKNNMFVIPLDSERNWYRYHHLFADLLRQRFRQENREMLTEVHTRASEWFEKQEMIDLAVGHALEIKDYKRSIELLDQMIERLWENGNHSAIIRYGELLPDEMIKQYPVFCLYYAWILIAEGQTEKAEPFLISAEEVAIDKKLIGKIAVAFAWLHSHKEHSDQIFRYCKTAMENLGEDDPMWISWAWFSYGIAYFSNGELEESRLAFNKALDFANKTENLFLISTIVIRLAENEQQLGYYIAAYKTCTDLLEMMNEKGYGQITKAEWAFAPLYFIMGTTQWAWADIESAYDSIKTAYKLSYSGKDIYLKVFILMFYSYILNLRGDPLTEAMVTELEDIMNQNTVPPFLHSMYVGWKIYFMLETKQLDKAIHFAEEEGMGMGEKISYANEAAYISYARILLEKHRLDDAEAVLSELLDLAEKGKWVERLIDIKILYSILYDLKGQREDGVSSLIQAIELAAKENIITYFISKSDHLEDLLQEVYKIQATRETKIPRRFIENIQQAFKNRDLRIKKREESELSNREIDTLKLIAEGLTNQEIADKLFISLNTVKTHLKNVNLKLDADSRTVAVSKARKLGVI